MWYLKEIQSPNGYIPNNDVMEVYINESDVQLDVKNSKFGKAEIIKIDENNNPIAGAKFTLYLDSVNEENIISNTLVSDENGRIEVGELLPGTYYLVETETPEDYILNNEVISFEVEAYNTTTVTRVNETKGYGVIKILKKDAVSKEQLGGTKIGIYSDPEYKNLIKEITTSENEAIVLNDLRPGTYYIKELEPTKGYLLDSAPKKVTIEKNQTAEVVFYNSKNYSTAGNYSSLAMIGGTILMVGATVLILKKINEHRRENA